MKSLTPVAIVSTVLTLGLLSAAVALAVLVLTHQSAQTMAVKDVEATVREIYADSNTIAYEVELNLPPGAVVRLTRDPAVPGNDVANVTAGLATATDPVAVVRLAVLGAAFNNGTRSSTSRTTLHLQSAGRSSDWSSESYGVVRDMSSRLSVPLKPGHYSFGSAVPTVEVDGKLHHLVVELPRP